MTYSPLTRPGAGADRRRTARKAIHSWSLFRTLGQFVAPGSMPSGDLPTGGREALSLLRLPALLAEHGYRSVQLCHFLLPSVEESYLADLRSSFKAAGVEVECFLVDDGDLTHPARAAEEEAWISRWVGIGEIIGAQRTRVIAGKQAPTPDTLLASARALKRIAAHHPQTRIVTENWHALLPDAASVAALLDVAGPTVGFLVDLGNWTGHHALDDLAAVSAIAETCQAKCRTRDDGSLDVDLYARSLTVLRNHGYDGSLALVYDGPDNDELDKLEEEFAIVSSVFGDGPTRTLAGH